MFEKVCDDCGCVFYAKSKKAHICPTCKRKRQSQQAKRRNLNKIGNDAYSKQQGEKDSGRDMSIVIKESPCRTCTRVEDPEMCNIKYCTEWRGWFVAAWNQMRERFKVE